MSEQVKKQDEKLNKSIDEMIDAFFAEEAKASEEVKKSEPKAEEKKEEASGSLNKATDAIHEIIGSPKQAKEEKDPNKTPATLADDAGNNPPKSEEDEKAGKKRGRPNDLSQMSMRDMSTGESKGSYDKSIVEASANPQMKEASQVQQPEHLKEKGSDKSANDSGSEEQSGASQASSDAPSLKEFSQIKLPEHMKKAEDTVTISKEEYEALKATQAESMKKSEEALIKAEVEKVTGNLRKENEELKKSVEETKNLIKSFLKKPQPRKSISSVGALEKSAGETITEESKEFSKSEKLDAAEALVKSGQLSDEDVIELDTTGTFLDPRKKDAVERKLRS